MYFVLLLLKIIEHEKNFKIVFRVAKVYNQKI